MLYHISFVVIFLAFTAIRAYYHRKAVQSRGKVEYKEGRLHTGLRMLVGIPFILSLFAYMLFPQWFAWGEIGLPDAARLAGVILGAASLPLILWIQYTLGSNFSTTLHVRDEHTLVTGGPYRWVRHPMYTVLFIHLAGLLLMSANWYIGGIPLVALCLIVITRVSHEERVMLEKFGDRYQAYMQRTGRFLPRPGMPVGRGG